MEIRVDINEAQIRRLLLLLLLFELCLTLVFVTSSLLDGPVWIVHKLFNLDRELNVPAWFSSMQLFTIGLVFLFKIFETQRTHEIPSRFLVLVGLGFIFLSADEASGIHEQFSISLSTIGGLPGFKGDGGHGYWIAAYAAIGAALAFSNLKTVGFIWTHYRRASIWIAVGMSFIVLGSAGLEFVAFQFLLDGDTPTLYMLEVAAEEFLEMAGASVVLCGALQLLLPDQRT